MHVGLIMECDYRYGESEQAAFDEAFAMAEAAEMGGLDGVWLAERHFAAPRSPLDTGGAGIPSVVSAPLIISSAIVARYERFARRRGRKRPAAGPSRPCGRGSRHPRPYQPRTRRVRRGPQRLRQGLRGLRHLLRREPRTLPGMPRRGLGRLDQRALFLRGKYYQFDDVCVIPKPFQKPHPPLRIAATTRETFPQVGRAGIPVFVGLRGMDRPALANSLNEYRAGWKDAGHAADSSVFLRIPVYVGETDEQAHADAEESTMRSYRRLAQNFLNSATVAGATPDEERVERGHRLSEVTYEDLLRDRLAYGNPDTVTKLMREIIDELGLDGIVAEVNVGGGISRDKVLASVKRFATEVAPNLR